MKYNSIYHVDLNIIGTTIIFLLFNNLPTPLVYIKEFFGFKDGSLLYTKMKMRFRGCFIRDNNTLRSVYKKANKSRIIIVCMDHSSRSVSVELVLQQPD